jgi:hypothetical protein
MLLSNNCVGTGYLMLYFHQTVTWYSNCAKIWWFGVQGVIKPKLRFGIASIANRTRDSKSRIMEMNRG